MSFTYYRTVHFQDTDAGGVVYFTNALSICHEAYEESLGASGINIKEFFSKRSIAYPIVHANVDFFRPIFCGDKLFVNLIPQKLSVEKFEINYEILVADVMVAKAFTRHVCIDTTSRQKTELPQQIIEWLEVNASEAEKAERKKSTQTDDLKTPESIY